VVSYSFISRENDDIWGTENQKVSIFNPLREELSTMRTSLLPGLLDIAARNAARRNMDLLLFEMGNVYIPKALPLKELPAEVLKIAGLAQGRNKRHWLTPEIKYDFFYVKGILENLAKECGVEFEYRRITSGKYGKLLHPGRSAEIYVHGELLGYIGEIYPQLDEKWELERPVLFELDFAVLFKNANLALVAKSYPRFPAVFRDLAVIVPVNVQAEDIRKRVLQLGGELLQEAEIFDVYQGQSIPAGHKSVAVTMRFQSAQRTLTDEEVNTLYSDILAGIQKEFGAEWRK